MEKLTLSSHYTIKNILRQCMSPILMMLFISIYGMVDGLFVSNFDGPDAFAGVNLIMPVISIIGGSGFMFGSGGSALASKLLGEKKREDANKVFSMMIYFSFLMGLVLSLAMFPFIDDFVILMAKLSNDATSLMIEKATLYGRILIFSQPMFIVGTMFQNFFVVDEKQKIGFFFTLAAGLTNMVFDALFIAVFKWGVAGAAVATMMGHFIQTVGPILYFKLNKDNLITIVKTKLDFKVIGKCAFNGLSDFIFNISANISGIVFNIQLLSYIGQRGVEVYGILMYTSFIVISIFIGISMGMAPIIGYNLGAKNDEELKFTLKNSYSILGVLSIIATVLAFAFARPLAFLFVKEKETLDLAVLALRLHALTFLFSGFSIFITGMFTALNNGVVSGVLSLFRSFIFQIFYIIVLPLLFGATGILITLLITELSSLIVAVILLEINRKKYRY